MKLATTLTVDVSVGIKHDVGFILGQNVNIDIQLIDSLLSTHPSVSSCGGSNVSSVHWNSHNINTGRDAHLNSSTVEKSG